MTLLVTGGAGFIGSHLIDHLLDGGNWVVCLDNLNDFYHPQIKRLNQQQHHDFDTFTFVEGDIRDQECVEKLFAEHDFDIVVHLAAMAGVRPSVEDPKLYVDVNINGTQILLDEISKHPVRKFLFASSSSVYGNNIKSPFSEDDSVDCQVSPYGATKKMGEVLCYTYHHLYRIPTACLRFFTAYGPRQRPEMAIHKFTRKLKREESIPFYGDGTTARDYTFIEDIVNGILQTMNAEYDYIIFNLGNSEPVKLADLVSILENAAGIEAVLDRQDLPPGDVLNTYADISRARQHLDYQPKVHIEAGIGKFMEWYNTMITNHGELYA